VRAISHTNRSSNPFDATVCRAGVVAVLAVQIVMGYEWLVSGITKVASGTFVSGLAADLKSNADSAPGFYRNLLHSTLIPNARTLAVLVEIGELAVGLTFIIVAIVWLTRWSQLSDGVRVSLLGATMLAALGATFMAINFHLARGGNHPWLIPADGMDETIDVDSVLSFLQLTVFVFCGYLLLRIRREHQATAVVAGRTPGALPAAS
jgi:uncharacterized membrane protein YphA (DoxX/SURF4 family)